MKKIDLKTYELFIQEFYKDLCKHERFGQAFINKFYPISSIPDLFYADNIDAQTYIEQNMVDYESK